MKKNVCSFYTHISFTVLKWDDCLSVQLPFELPVQIQVQLLLELEPKWLVQNVIELEFELSRMYMKQTIVHRSAAPAKIPREIVTPQKTATIAQALVA